MKKSEYIVIIRKISINKNLSSYGEYILDSYNNMFEEIKIRLATINGIILSWNLFKSKLISIRSQD